MRELIEDLKEFDPDCEVGFCTGEGSDLTVLSIYHVSEGYRPEDSNKVWFDLEVREAKRRAQ